MLVQEFEGRDVMLMKFLDRSKRLQKLVQDMEKMDLHRKEAETTVFYLFQTLPYLHWEHSKCDIDTDFIPAVSLFKFKALSQVPRLPVNIHL